MKKLLPIIILCLILCGCSNQTPVSKTGFALDTVATITIYDKNIDAKVLDDTFLRLSYYESIFSRTIPDSDISKINNNPKTPVSVSSDTIELINLGLYYSELSNGIFDITALPLTSLWDFKSENSTIPDENLLSEALKHIDYTKVYIDYNNNTVTLLDDNMGLDLGGIAKGYIADKLKDYLISKGVKSCVINLGGNVLVIGDKNNAPFNIGIRKPFGNPGEIVKSVNVSDTSNYSSVVSSGTYERYFNYNGRLYHHILDLSTGYPCNNNINGVTILSKKSVDGDALSTICFLLGEEKGRELINSLPDTDVIFY